MPHYDSALSFAASAPVPETGREAVIQRIHDNPSADTWTAEAGEYVYVLCSVKIPATSGGSRFSQDWLDRSYRKRAEIKASSLAAEHGGGRGIQFASTVIGDKALCFAWAEIKLRR